MTTSKLIAYPYMPEGGVIEYAPANNPFMIEAREYARKHSLDRTMPNASLIVKNGKVIGRGANGSAYHKTHVCERVRLNVPSGQGYELCGGCHPKNHSEPKAINDARSNRRNTQGASIYLWGHWWCCEPCWDAMKQAGIYTVFLLKDSERLFNKSHPDNIVGKQFA